MNLRSRKSGFILMFTMMILAAGVVLVGAVAMRVHNAIIEHRFLVARERAKVAAMGGVELVRTRLTHKIDKKNDESVRLWLLSYNDVWQKFPLPGEDQLAEDSVYLRFSCEDGKLDINSFFDRSKKVFDFGKKDGPKPFWERLSSWVGSFSGEMGEGGFFGALQTALKESKEPLIDFTQIFSKPVFKNMYMPIFPPPPQVGEEGVLSSSSALSDIFVMDPVVEEDVCIQPQFFTRAFQEVLELKPLPQGKEEREQWAKALAKKWTDSAVDWRASWDSLLAGGYGVKLGALEKKYAPIVSLFCKAARESLVSVVSYAFIGGVTQGVYAVLRPYQGRDNMKVYVIKRLYWI